MFSSGIYWDSSRILDIPERESSVEWVWHWDGPVSWRCEILLGLGLASRKRLYWPHRAACCVTEGEEGLPDWPWWTVTVIILHAGWQVLGLCQLLRAWRMAGRMHMPCFRNRKKKCVLCASHPRCLHDVFCRSVASPVLHSVRVFSVQTSSLSSPLAYVFALICAALWH